MKWLEIIGDALLIGAGASFIFIFGSIKLTGGYTAIENNPWILWFELIFCGFGLFLIGLNRLIDDLKSKHFRGIKIRRLK